jgi:CHRD domain
MNSIPTIRHCLPGIVAAATLALSAFSISATADELLFKLSGDAEVPPVATTASGTGAITINPDMTVSGKVTTSGVAATMAHIHIGKAGANGAVVVTLAKSGDNVWLVPDGTRLSEAAYQSYKAGELYVNVHSAEHKAGEIRGQLNPPKASAY